MKPQGLWSSQKHRQPQKLRSGDRADRGSHRKSPQGSLSPNDRGAAPKEARTRVLLRQLRRNLRLRERKGPEDDPGNGHSKWSRKNLLRKRKKKKKLKSPLKRTEQLHHETSTSFTRQVFPREKTALTTYCFQHIWPFHFYFTFGLISYLSSSCQCLVYFWFKLMDFNSMILREQVVNNSNKDQSTGPLLR